MSPRLLTAACITYLPRAQASHSCLTANDLNTSAINCWRQTFVARVLRRAGDVSSNDSRVLTVALIGAKRLLLLLLQKYYGSLYCCQAISMRL